MTFPASPAALLSTAGATLTATPSDPTGTTSTAAYVMMGFGTTCAITPTKSSRLLVSVYGQIGSTIANDGASYQFRYGTGTAPINGAAATGTLLGSSPGVIATVNNQEYPFNLTLTITGLTPGTAYWMDLGVAATLGGTTKLNNLTCTATEI
jgi:hypothetical protein